MAVLRLGVVDIPYADKSGNTTGKVATFLEARYGILGAFVKAHGKDIAGDLERSVGAALDDVLGGLPARDPFGEATSSIERRMRLFLSSQEVERSGVPGTPTKAALGGVTSRFKRGRKPGRRPSFIDTGLMERSYRAWFTF